MRHSYRRNPRFPLHPLTMKLLRGAFIVEREYLKEQGREGEAERSDAIDHLSEPVAFILSTACNVAFPSKGGRRNRDTDAIYYRPSLVRLADYVTADFCEWWRVLSLDDKLELASSAIAQHRGLA
jgi:hypothetical protein